MITDNDIKRQKIINLERSILLHTINKSPIPIRIQEIRSEIARLKREIAMDELGTDYYCYSGYVVGGSEPKTSIGYGEWKKYSEEIFEKIKKMNEDEVEEVYGVNPNILKPNYGLKWTGDIGDWSKQTYTKDENFKPFTLKVIQNMWKAIFREKQYRERRKRMTKLILREIGQKKCFQYEVDDKIKYSVGDPFKIYWPASRKNKECGIVKILGEERKSITLVLKNLETGKHYNVQESSRYGCKEKAVKLGDILFYVDRKDISKVNRCVCVKIIERGKKKKPKKPKGVVFSEFSRKDFKMPLYKWMKDIIKTVMDQPGAYFIVTPHRKAGKNHFYKVLEEMKKERENRRLHQLKLKEFHKRPYFKTILETVKGKPLGKENLDKIKFPCYCSYMNIPGERELGQINKGRNYELYHVGKQGEMNYVDGSFQTLKGLMTVYNVHILKGELRLWEVAK